MTGKRTADVDKSIIVPYKPKKLPELSLYSHFEAVVEKLNELLNPEGGISKRKDAWRGYLKLLFLTAASGNNGHGETIQSNQDLSMILDAMLKTKSRTVLIDIINKNGLQMLHNIMMRYRREFIKTPILRKLLKVLEYLAMRDILTLEHISGGPARPGVESFKDSILILTEHGDKQVHQIARNFRDKWIPRHMRKNGCKEMVDGRMEYNPHSSYPKFPVLHDHGSDRKLSKAMVLGNAFCA
ncbi:histone-lysine N-methyltransferase ASHH2-like [Olea europaea subsp. europaea]|uniref:Histone-lysine N-methyltransferase ASHH2-like n=1 Tax=Olea europaea subsp. europaea TaxID=158383 RepID=A0A8S0V4L0_OLEEU|nr:histone-lysine N-methyltransferase ASHH2-like [Olea europaea subsp. europaea]